MKNSACSNHTIRVDKLEKAVLVYLQTLISIAIDLDEIKEERDTLKTENEELKKTSGNLEKVQKELEDIKKADYKSKYEKLVSDNKALYFNIL